MKKVLFICKKRIDSYGTPIGLINSANFTSNALNDLGIESKVVSVIDNNHIEREAIQYKPTHVFIQALWVVPEKIHLLVRKYPNIKWSVRIHSEAPFIAGEGIAFEWLYKYNIIWKCHKNFFISSNNRRFTDDLISVGIYCKYFPNIYRPGYSLGKLKDKRPDILDVGCFGAIRPLKNQLIQAIGAIKYSEWRKKKLRFHINSNRLEQKGEATYKNIVNLFKGSNHELVEHDWMPHIEFMDVVRYMDIGLQVSFSETFNIVSADFVSCGVPIVTSKEVNWLPFYNYADTNSSDSIAKRMDFLLRYSRLGLNCINKKYLSKYNKHSENIWKNSIN